MFPAKRCWNGPSLVLASVTPRQCFGVKKPFLKSGGSTCSSLRALSGGTWLAAARSRASVGRTGGTCTSAGLGAASPPTAAWFVLASPSKSQKRLRGEFLFENSPLFIFYDIFSVLFNFFTKNAIVKDTEKSKI